MPALPLHQTEDWTRVGAVLTFLVLPGATDVYLSHYSYLDASGQHVHTTETKSSWSDATWTLAHVPDGIELSVFKQTANVLSWWSYGNPDDKRARCMNHDVNTGAFISWLTAELSGFDNTSNEQVTMVRCRPNASFPVYFATKDSQGVNSAARLYRWNGTGTAVTKVFTLVPGADDDRHITDIVVEQANPNSVWFTVGGTVAVGAAAHLGVYHASDGVTFAKVHNGWSGGTNPNNVYGALQIVVKEGAPRRIWCQHQYTTTDADLSYSDDEGATWTGLLGWVNSVVTMWHMSSWPYGTDDTVHYLAGRSPALFPVNNSWEGRVLGPTLTTSQTTPLVDDPTLGGGYHGGRLSSGKLLYLESDSAVGGNGTLWDSAGFGLGWGAVSPNGEWVAVGPTGAAKENYGSAGVAIHGSKPWIAAVRNADISSGRLSIDGGVTWQDIALPGAGRCVGFVELSG